MNRHKQWVSAVRRGRKRGKDGEDGESSPKRARCPSEDEESGDGSPHRRCKVRKPPKKRRPHRIVKQRSPKGKKKQPRFKISPGVNRHLREFAIVVGVKILVGLLIVPLL